MPGCLSQPLAGSWAGLSPRHWTCSGPALGGLPGAPPDAKHAALHPSFFKPKHEQTGVALAGLLAVVFSCEDAKATVVGALEVLGAA